MVLQDAFEIAQRYLDEFVRPEHRIEIVIARCKEIDGGWEFDYNSRAFLEERDFSAALAGNGPVVVPRTGEAPYVGSVFRR
jgi:hypothetical protein